MRRPGATGSMLAAVLLLVSGVEAGEPGSLDDPRLGGPRGRLRSRVVRAPGEVVEVPDVLTLKDGTSLEAYWLAAYGDRLVFFVKETEGSWLREEVSRADVAEV